MKSAVTRNRLQAHTGSELLVAPSVNFSELYLDKRERHLQRMQQQGSLLEWKSQIGVHAEANDIPLVLCCLSLASVLLSWAGLSTSIFNLHGKSGKGKTLCLQIAASIWGNGCDPAVVATGQPYIQKVNATDCGLEALSPTFQPLPLILDELGERGGKDLGRLIYSLASGASKIRMGSDLKLAAQTNWLLTVLVSSEVSVSELMRQAGDNQMDGQADRAADIPLPVQGIFSNYGCFSALNGLTRHLKSATGQYYGTAGMAFINYCLGNKALVQGALQCLDEYVAELAPKGCDEGQRRVVMRFMLGVLAGILAREAGIFSCEEDRIAEAFKGVIELWWRPKKSALSRVQELLDSEKVCIRNAPPEVTLKPNEVFRHDGLITFQRDFFKSCFPKSERNQILDCLSRAQLLKGQSDDKAKRHGKRYCDGKFHAFSIYESKLRALMESTDHATESQTL